MSQHGNYKGTITTKESVIKEIKYFFVRIFNRNNLVGYGHCSWELTSPLFNLQLSSRIKDMWSGNVYEYVGNGKFLESKVRN